MVAIIESIRNMFENKRIVRRWSGMWRMRWFGFFKCCVAIKRSEKETMLQGVFCVIHH